jgi:phage repressor protein C with HTH and peptisase S24 domain
MAPTLMAGDQLLVDAAALAPIRDGLHVLRINGALAVRRVAVHPAGGRLSLLADNPAWPPFPDCDPESLSIVGRVIWIGRRLG